MDENRCTSRNVTVKFPSTNKRKDPTGFFHIKDQKAERHDFSKSNIRIWNTLGQCFQNSQEKIISNL